MYENDLNVSPTQPGQCVYQIIEKFNPKLSSLYQSQSKRQVGPPAHLVLCSVFLAGSRGCAD